MWKTQHCEEETNTQALAYLGHWPGANNELISWINLLKEIIWNPSGGALRSRLNKTSENGPWEGVFCWQKTESDDLRRAFRLQFLAQRHPGVSNRSGAQGLQMAPSRDGKFKCSCCSWYRTLLPHKVLCQELFFVFLVGYFNVHRAGVYTKLSLLTPQSFVKSHWGTHWSQAMGKWRKISGSFSAVLKPAVHLCDWKQMTWSLCVVVVYPHCLQRILEVTACAFSPSNSPALTVCEGGYQGVHLFAQKPLGLSCCTTGFLASSETLCCCASCCRTQLSALSASFRRVSVVSYPLLRHSSYNTWL